MKKCITLLATILLATGIFAQVEFMKKFGNTQYDHNCRLARDAAGNIYYAFTHTGIFDADPGAAVVNTGTAGMPGAAVIKLNPAGDFVAVNYMVCSNASGNPSVKDMEIDDYNNTVNLVITYNGNNSTLLNVNPNGTAVNYANFSQNELVFVRYSTALAYNKSFIIGGAGCNITPSSICVSSGFGQNERVHIAFSASGTFDINPYASVLNVSSVGFMDAYIITCDLTFDNFGWFNHIYSGANANNTIGDLALGKSPNLVAVGSCSGAAGATLHFDDGVGNFTTTLSGIMDNGFIFNTGIANGWAFEAPYIVRPAAGGACSLNMVCKKDITGGSEYNVFGNLNGTADFNDLPSQTANLTAGSSSSDMLWLRVTSGGSGWGYNDCKKYSSANSGTAIPRSAFYLNNNVYVSGNFINTVNFSTAGTANLVSLGGMAVGDGFIARYDYNSYGLQKAFKISSNVNTDDEGREGNLTVDNLGNVYYAGNFNSTTSFYTPGVFTQTSTGWQDVALVKYTPVAVPVVLTTFTARLNIQRETILNWSVEQQGKIATFSVEHSRDANHFTEVGIVPFGGSSYSFVHKEPVAGNNYYRLKMTDVDGKITYSNIVLVSVRNADQKISVYPNPSTGIVTVHSVTANELSLLDGSGKLLKKMQQLPGSTMIDLSGFSNGTYYIRSGNETVSFIKKQ